MRKSDLSRFNVEKHDEQASEFAKLMHKIPTSVGPNQNFVQVEHLETVNTDRLADQDAMLRVRLTIRNIHFFNVLQRIANLELRLASLETKAVDSAKFDSDKSSLSDFGSVLFFCWKCHLFVYFTFQDDFEELSEPEKQRFKQLESALALTQASLAEVKDQNAVLERDNVDLKRKLDESKKAYNRLVNALDNVLHTAKV